MVTITLSVPKEMKLRMDEHPEMNWSEVARHAFDQKLKDLDFLHEFKSKSTMTEEEAVEQGRELNSKLVKKYITG